MAELLADAPELGQRLNIESDRSFERPGDAVIRMRGERTQDGVQMFDSTYVEVDEHEAEVVARVLESARQPTPYLLDHIAREVQATFTSKIGGRDSHQIATLAAQAWWEYLCQMLPPKDRETRFQSLEERFSRAAAKSRTSPGFTTGNGHEAED